MSAGISQRKYVFDDPIWVTCQWWRVKPNLVLQRSVPLQWHHTDTKPVPSGQSPSEHVVSMCVCVCFSLGVNWPFHQLASLAAECRGWWGNEGFSKCPPQAEQKARIPELALATCTDWSVWREFMQKYKLQLNNRFTQQIKKQHFTINRLQAANNLFTVFDWYMQLNSRKRNNKDEIQTLWICFISTSFRDKNRQKETWLHYSGEKNKQKVALNKHKKYF